MKKKQSKVILLILISVLLLGLTTPIASSNTHVGLSPPMTRSVNPLTGLPMPEYLAEKRPLAISLSNTIAALPMNGISHADIVYEMLVESNITRVLALYQDISGVGPIGSIRSARHYSVQIAQSYDAIFVSAGGSPQGYAEVEALGIPHLDEVAGRHSGMFYRDLNRIRGRTLLRYHSAVTTGELVTRWLPGFGYRLTHDANFTNALSFVENGTPAGGGNAAEVIVRFAAGNTSNFTYNSLHNIYTMQQFNMDFVDANDYSHPAFTNLLVLKTSVTPIPGDGAGRLEIITTGSGSGYFANGGRFIEINWFRPDKNAPFIYTHRDGSLLNLGQGKTYIAIIPTEMDATFR